MSYLLMALFAGMLMGYGGLINPKWEKAIAGIFNFSFLALLTTLGAAMAVNQEVVANLGIIGIQALVFALLTSISAVLIAQLLIQVLAALKFSDSASDPSADLKAEEGKTRWQMALVPVLAIVVGGLWGYLTKHLLDLDYALLVLIFLYALILGIGIDIGRSKKGFKYVKEVGWIALLVPLCSLVGGITGGAIAGLLFRLPLPVFLAVGAGSGFYSITASLVSTAVGAHYGALALMANFLRELLTIVGIPLIATKYRYVSLITIGGATTMDTTLPVVARSLGAKAAVIALVQGIILTMLVPIFVSLFLKLQT